MIKIEPIDFKNLSEAEIKDLYPDLDTRNYVKEQEEKFKACLPELKLKYPGQYIVFEDGLIIDSDLDEIALLIRASKNTILRSRPLVFCKFIPNPKEVEYWLNLLEDSISLFLTENDELQKRNSSKLNRAIFAGAFYLYIAFEASYVNQFDQIIIWTLLILLCTLIIWISNIYYWSESAPRYNVRAKKVFSSLRTTLSSCSQREDHGFWERKDRERMRKALRNADEIYNKYDCIYHPEKLGRVY